MWAYGDEYYLKNVCRKLSDATWVESIGFISAIIVQVEPVGQLNLEANPHQVATVFRWQVYDEPTGGK